MTAFAVLITIVVGYIASAIGYQYFEDFQSLGPIVSIAVMGGFILRELKNIK